MSDDEGALAAEFDVLAEWTAQAVLALGADHAIPAACRGSATPVALDWLGEVCGLKAGSVLLDVGGGVGGPAAYASERFGVTGLLVEPMPGAVSAAVRLFGSTALVGTGERLPLASGSVDAAWCLGVLCTTPAKAEVLAEIHRVLRPGSALGLLVLVADEPHPEHAPEGNEFPSLEEMAKLLAVNGFEEIERRRTADFPAAPQAWTERIDRVDEAVVQAHEADRRFGVIREQEQRMGRLLKSGVVESLVIHAVAGPARR
jgi:SAM-dependent methyltransferase